MLKKRTDCEAADPFLGKQITEAGPSNQSF